MLDAACNFVHDTIYNAKYDITWSFQYSLCGAPGSTGGFTTFLYDPNVGDPVGGGARSGLGYGPCVIINKLLVSPTRNFFAASPYLDEDGNRRLIRFADGYPWDEHNEDGIRGAIMGVGFDSTGQFALCAQGFKSGIDIAAGGVAVPNSYTYRIGTQFEYVSTYAAPFNVLENTDEFKTLRFNLTDLGQTLNIHLYDNMTQSYQLINSIQTQLLFMQDKVCRLGFSYASPVSGYDKVIFKLKHFHAHGKL
jgi:hypothetical protein